MRTYRLTTLVAEIVCLIAANSAHGVAYKASIRPALSGFPDSYPYGISGSSQVGTGTVSGFGSVEHAMLWNGTPTAIDLNPNGFSVSEAWGVSGSDQVGDGTNAAERTHALLWHGTASGAVDLNPAGFNYSSADGISGNTQVGYAWNVVVTTDVDHAMLWRGTAASAIDLHPAGYNYSLCAGFSGIYQVGYAYLGNQFHAMFWNGTAASAVDLNPSGFTTSAAYSGNGNNQVGDGNGAETNMPCCGTALLPASSI
jgi:hypothetical protein